MFLGPRGTSRTLSKTNIKKVQVLLKKCCGGRFLYFQRCEELHVLPKIATDMLGELEAPEQFSLANLLTDRPEDATAMLTKIARACSYYSDIFSREVQIHQR